jgi:hypothetical protein
MKVSTQSIEFMQESLEKIIQYHAKKQNIILSKNDIDSLPISVMHNLWYQVSINIKFDNNNANVIFIDGKRLFEQNDKFDYYIDNTNDKTIETALKLVFKKIENNLNS